MNDGWYCCDGPSIHRNIAKQNTLSQICLVQQQQLYFTPNSDKLPPLKSTGIAGRKRQKMMDFRSRFFFQLLQVSLLTSEISAFLPSTIHDHAKVSPPLHLSEIQQAAAVKTSLINRLAASQNSEEDYEFISRDEAETTPQLLRGVWSQISQGSSMVNGVRSRRLWETILHFASWFWYGILTGFSL